MIPCVCNNNLLFQFVNSLCLEKVTDMWNFGVVSVRNKSQKVGQQPAPTFPRHRRLSYFAIFKLKNKSWNIGQHPHPTRHMIWDFEFLSFLNWATKLKSRFTTLLTRHGILASCRSWSQEQKTESRPTTCPHLPQTQETFIFCHF